MVTLNETKPFIVLCPPQFFISLMYSLPSNVPLRSPDVPPPPLSTLHQPTSSPLTTTFPFNPSPTNIKPTYHLPSPPSSISSLLNIHCPFSSVLLLHPLTIPLLFANSVFPATPWPPPRHLCCLTVVPSPIRSLDPHLPSSIYSFPPFSLNSDSLLSSSSTLIIPPPCS